MSLYSMPSLELSSFPSPLGLGAVPAASNLNALVRASTVLSNMRYAATMLLPPGVNLSGNYLAFFAPIVGRGAAQIIAQSPNSGTVTSVYCYSMTGSAIGASTTSTSANITNPTDLRGATGLFWQSASMVLARTYCDLTSYGLARWRVNFTTATSPLAVSIIRYPGAISSANHAHAGYRPGGAMSPAWPNTSTTLLGAGVARTIEAAIEAAECQPIIVGMVPQVPPMGATWAKTMIRRAMTVQVPLSRPKKPKAFYVGARTQSSTSMSWSFRVGGQQITQWQTVYASGQNWVAKARLFDEAYAAQVGLVGGVPIVNCTLVDCPSDIVLATAFIAEDFDL